MSTTVSDAEVTHVIVTSTQIALEIFTGNIHTNFTENPPVNGSSPTSAYLYTDNVPTTSIPLEDLEPASFAPGVCDRTRYTQFHTACVPCARSRRMKCPAGSRRITTGSFILLYRM